MELLINHMKNKLLQLIALAMLTGGTALAGSFTNSFTNPDNTTGFIVQGSGTLADASAWQPTVSASGLLLTPNQGSLGGALILSDFNNQQTLQSFTAKFQMLLDGAADGVSFAFGPDISDGTGVFGETGPGLGQGGFAISFDLYNNGAPDFIGISTYLSGIEYGTVPMTLSDTAWKDVTIQLNRNGSLNMSFDGKVIYTNFALPNYLDVPGQFAFGARTGGSSANQGVRNMSIVTTEKGADVDATITSQPASLTINEKDTATFEVGFDGTPPFTFQWSRNGTDIADATSNFLILTNVLASENGAKFKCTVANSTKSLTSTEAILTVKSDVVAPKVLSVAGAIDLSHVTLVLSKPVTAASAENTANYQIDNNLTVSAATLSTNDLKTVVLTTSGQKSSTTYTITINGIKDTTAAANAIAANTKATFVSESMKVVGAGAIQKSGENTYGIGIAFNMAFDNASATKLANYTLSGGSASAIAAYKAGVVLTASGLQADTIYTISVANVKDSVGNVMPTASSSFKISKMQWGVVGGNELAFGNAVIPVGDNGFDVYSDGIGEWGTYDEATFVYEEITGDFDKRVRVEYQDSSSQWARAGLIVRDVTNFGVDRSAQDTGAAGRYQKVHVNPVTTAMGTAGNNSWEGNRRLTTGAATTSAGGNGTPKYPNAWCRLQRVGQTFTIYRSDDGTTWTQLGATTFDPAMPDKVFVGPEYTPENGNITDGLDLRGTWLAKFRDYGDTPLAGQQPAEFGKTVNGFQDEFKGATRDPNWVAVGPGGDNYPQQDGVLKVFPATGDPNHLLYMGAGASNMVSEVLARIRVVNFSSGDPARGGIAVNVSSNTTSKPNQWIGMNLNIRNNSEGTPASTVHFKILDDLRGWGPQTTFGWTNNVWYWMRLRQESKMDGTNSVFAKVWAANTITPEPADWQIKWADASLPAPQHGGFPGITGCSAGGVGQFEVSYILIKSASLPSIKVDFTPTAPAKLNVPVFTGVTGSSDGKSVSVNWFGGGTLQSNAALSGSWLDITNTLPPLVVPLTGAAGQQNFYRIKK